MTFVAATILFVVFKKLTKRSGKLLYVHTEASAALIEQDRLEEEKRKAKKNKKAPSILGDEADLKTEDNTADDPSDSTPDNSEKIDDIPENSDENQPEISDENKPEISAENEPEISDENEHEKVPENQSENSEN